MIKVLKASAGSGKTFNLALEYISLAVRDDRRDAYRHILAVTFTNKATEEMKNRILRELYRLANNPEQSSYTPLLVPDVVPDVDTLRRRAAMQLSGILHDYSAFAVSTIDKFFQQTLRAFSREVGQFASYQIQLDTKAMVAEGVDRVLDGLGEGDDSLLEWLTEGARKDLERSGRFSLEGRLSSMGESLATLPEGAADSSYSELRELDSFCSSLMEGFVKRVSAAAQKVIDTLESKGIEPEDTASRWLKAIRNYTALDRTAEVKRPTDAFAARAQDPSKWFTKANESMRLSMEGVLDGPLGDFIGLFDKPFKEYSTARKIREQIYTLGVAGELRKAFADLRKENNVMSLDDSNAILRNIIDDTPTPFIYEKLGVRFESFLLDEFQDTSLVQWENFRPLVHNSQDSGFESLIVGDVKQSIYRWRGSDWNLLGSAIEKEFAGPGLSVKALKENYRTAAPIVAFNNAFFGFAAEKLGLQDIYSDVVQEPKLPSDVKGSVEVKFTDDMSLAIEETIRELRERNAAWSDIAVLVRGNAEGSSVASLLVSLGIPVVSDDSLFVKSSVTVRRLVSQISLVEGASQENERSVAGFLARDMGMEIPSSYHSLTDLAEYLLRGIRNADPETFDAEIPYIQSFMDFLQDWTVNSGAGNNAGAFLKAWDEASPKIASPSSSSAVRVITIHKSKGLEFPFVIFPYAEKTKLYVAPQMWCSPALEGSLLEGKAEGYYNVKLDGSADDTLFADSGQKERYMQTVDGLNVLYVALTRPQYGIKILAARPPKSFADSPMTEFKDLSQLLYAYTGGQDFFSGEYHVFGGEKESADRTVSISWPSYPAFEEGKERLMFSPEAEDYFGPDGDYGIFASGRIRGNVLHGILQDVKTIADLPDAVEYAVTQGLVPRAEKDSVISFLEDAVSCAHGYGWFSPDAVLRLERSIIDAAGREKRPDRVVLHPNGRVDVIDYKFGHPEDKYRRQVAGYVSLYRALGYENVSGFLWYVPQKRIERV